MNVHFEQIGKQIHIYYDLGGEEVCSIQIYYSTNDGQTWGGPLLKVTGAVGENQNPGQNKEIIWEVLTEKESLQGEIKFKITAASAFVGTSGIFKDNRDDHTYKWVRIDNQIWMAENLNFVIGKSWCYKNNPTNCIKYGRLYEWESAQNVCPDGWHLVSDNEWGQIEMKLGMQQNQVHQTGWRGTDEGKKLKGSKNWAYNGNGRNLVGLSTFPGGCRTISGEFSDINYAGYWWTSTSESYQTGVSRTLNYNHNDIHRYRSSKSFGFSVRCLKD